MEFEGYPQNYVPMSRYGGGATMAVRSLAGILPDYSIRQYQQQPFQQQYPSQDSSNQNMTYQYQHGQQFAGQTGTNYKPNIDIGQHQPQFMQQQASRPQQGGFAGYQAALTPSHAFQSQSLQMQQDFSYNQPQQFPQIPSGQYLPIYASRVSSGFQQPLMRSSSNVAANSGVPMYQQLVPEPIRRTSSNSSLQGSSIRGPPRKPKQSGHALWVGHLRPRTHIVDLKDHFARDASNDIESVFLVPKSNSAFVNYKTEPSCAAAMSRFHDSKFQGVRLVCRLRRGNASTANATKPSPVTAPSTSTAAHAAAKSEDTTAEDSSVVEETMNPAPANQSVEKVPEKFFVVKSLTIEDLERSLQTGIWATQAHNEDALNKAYQTTEKVYLIFSANKSGEYFGYARMDSAIDDGTTAEIAAPSRPESSDVVVPDLPLTIPTPATATAPKGRIVDDSSRGTIFWEADNDEKDEPKKEELGDISGYESAASAGISPIISQPIGKPFKIAWVSTERLSFYRTSGLRNPWNANREVKIARDGTEIEPGVGRRLIGMFHRPQTTFVSPSSGQPSAMHPMSGGYMGQPSRMPANPHGTMFHQN